MARFPAAPRAMVALPAEWELISTSPGAFADPNELRGESIPAEVPGTVAMAYARAGRALDGVDLDASDHWFRARFAGSAGETFVLRLDGLATICDVWWNGAHLARSESAYEPVESAVTLAAENEIVLRFASLKKALAAKRGRPRWKTKLVKEQQLRWFRTPLVGRMPGWSAGPAPVGPMFEARLERPWIVDADRARLVTKGTAVEARFVIAARGVTAAKLLVGEVAHALTVDPPDDRGHTTVRGAVDVGEVRLWWPHTHGEPFLYEARLAIEGAEPVTLDLGKIGFRRLEATSNVTDEPFALRVNGAPIFCRGASWTTDDVASLRFRANREKHGLFDALEAAKHAGINMIRVGGTMHYESPDFYARCDELGILVWQDFMFANMDYPIDDATFAAAVAREAEVVVARAASHASVAVFCGGSEVQQQAAMVGAPHEAWSSRLFEEILPRAVRSASNVAYIPGTPYGGGLPFHTKRGVTHYYGVGAYLRPLEDARRAEVGFATECLAFANVPEPRALDALFPDSMPVVHHPLWKARSPRDHGSGWDFDDVRDHYFKELFGLDPLAVRYSDPERYLALSRVVPAELIERTFAEWRRAGSKTNGALVWFWKDLVLGAGWGALDSNGWPKSVYYAMLRAFAPLTIFFTDEGLNGLALHVVNDTAWTGRARTKVRLLRRDGTVVHEGDATSRIEARTSWSMSVETHRFFDTTHAYRFGPPSFDLAVATMELDDTDATDGAPPLPAPAFLIPGKFPSIRDPQLGLRARFDGARVVVTTSRFAPSVVLDVDEFLPLDNHFHLEPGGARVVELRQLTPNATPTSGTVTSLHAERGVSIERSTT